MELTSLRLSAVRSMLSTLQSWHAATRAFPQYCAAHVRPIEFLQRLNGEQPCTSSKKLQNRIDHIIN
eukprot:1376081-Pleurochrysis_carterae.AAC.1